MPSDNVVFASQSMLKLAADDPAILGLLLTGSAGRGEAGPTSDVDFHVVHSHSWRQRKTWIEQGVEIEAFFNPPWRVRQYFSDELQEGRGVTLHMFAFGQILLDRNGTLAQLVAEATDLWRAGPPPLTQADLERIGYFLSDGYNDIADVASDPHLLAWLGVRQLDGIITHYFRLKGEWLPKSKQRLRRLAQDAPEFYGLVTQYLADPASPQGLATLRALTESLAARFALPIFQGWTTQPEELTPP